MSHRHLILCIAVLAGSASWTAAAQQLPYGGTATVLPGRIQAERYDTGGQNIAYYDDSAGNSGGAFRTDNVDITNCYDTDCSPTIGWFNSGEWLEYTVNVSQQGVYSLKARVGTALSGTQFKVEVDGGALSGNVGIPTGSWGTLTTVSAPNVTLTSGTHVLRFTNVSGPFDFNWFEFALITPTGTQSPYGGAARVVPSRVQAEHYDTGGQNIAYFDDSAGNSGGAVRSDDVDITACYDVDCSPTIGWFNAGQWLEYTVQVNTAGSFRLKSRVGTGVSGAVLGLSIDGVAASPNMSVPVTGWGTLTTVTGPTFNLSTGQHVVRISDVSGQFDFNWFEIESTTASPQPYTGTPIAIPGRIQAENFDLGGQNVAYYDDTPTNAGGAYRPSEAVDISNCYDTECSPAIGWFNSGEWMKYSINVTTAGNYTITARAASPSGVSKYRVEVDGLDVTGTQTVPNTSWTAFSSVSKHNIVLTQGLHVVRFVNTSGSYNLNWLEIMPANGYCLPGPDGNPRPALVGVNYKAYRTVNFGDYGPVKDYHIAKAEIDAQLTDFRTRGHDTIRIWIDFWNAGIHGAGPLSYFDNSGSQMPVQGRTNLANLLATLQTKGFRKVFIAFGPAYPSYSNYYWQPLNASRLSENWGFIQSAMTVINASGIDFAIDLYNELTPPPGSSTTWDFALWVAYDQAMWQNFANAYGTTRSVGTSVIESRVERFSEIYGANTPPMVEFHAYENLGSWYTSIVTKLRAQGLGSKRLVIGETFANDSLNANDLASAIATQGANGLPIDALIWWPMLRNTTTYTATSPEFANYVIPGLLSRCRY